MKLKISPDLSLPIDCVTGTHAILGRKRTGKTYKAKVIAESMLAAGQQIVVIDPTNAWWGLRSSADGKRAGYPITIFGGRNGDLPLDPSAAVDLARAVINDGFSAIFVLKGMSNAAEQRFCAVFLETMYTDNQLKPLHIFMDEADLYAPQMPQGEEMRTLGATKKIVRRGGLDGIGITLITHRSADLAKSVLTQCDTLIALGLSHPADLTPVSDWVKVQVKSLELAAEMMEDLPELPVGDAWIWSPHHKIRQRVTFRDLETYDSSRSPKPGEKARAPKVLSEIDIQKLGERIAATVEQAKQNDPKLLKVEVARLKKANDVLSAGMERAIQDALAKAGKTAAKPAKDAAVVERKVIKDSQLTRIEALIATGGKLVELWDNKSADAHEMLVAVHGKAEAHYRMLDAGLAELREAVASTKAPPPSHTNGAQSAPQRIDGVWRLSGTLPDPRRSVASPLLPGQERRIAKAATLDRVHTPRSASENGSPRNGNSLPIGEAAILGALIQYPNGIELRQLSTLTGYRRRTRDAYIQRLRERGLITKDGNRARATDEGRSALPDVESLPVGDALQDWWMQRLPSGEAQVLKHLIVAYPNSIGRDTIDEATGFQRRTRDVYLSRLAARELVTKVGRGEVRAVDALFEEPS